jgi:hypothetical protein
MRTRIEFATLFAALVLATLQGCDHDTTGHDVRTQANAMRIEVNAASDITKAVGAYIPFVCNVRGETSRECNGLHDAYDAARESIKAAHAAIDLYDGTGVMLAGADAASRGIRDAANAFARQVLTAVEAVKDGLENVAGEPGSEADRSGAQPAPAPEAAAEDPGEGAAPAAPR